MTPAFPTLVDPAQLIGIGDIAKRYGVAAATVCVWRSRYGEFPAPVCRISGVPAFLLDEVERWHSAWTSARRTP